MIRLPEVLEILYQDGGNQITQLFQRALKSCKHLVGGWESLPLASRFHPCPLFPAPMWLFSEDPLPHAARPNLGAQHPSRSQSSFPLPPRSEGKRRLRPRSGFIHQPERKRGRREGRRAAGGGVCRRPGAPVGTAEEERPSPRALIAVASCPSPPACVRGSERAGSARWG